MFGDDGEVNASLRSEIANLKLAYLIACLIGSDAGGAARRYSANRLA